MNVNDSTIVVENVHKRYDGVEALRGVNLTLFDVPPFMWVPAALLLPAVVLGWIGLT